MLSADFIASLCEDLSIDHVTGVPDSVLAPGVDYLDKTSISHSRATHEGSAVGAAIGHYLATGKPSIVYLQNSGLSNALNPLLSLAHKDVYSIPMVLVIGWRGMPGTKDEPQHMVQGAVTESMTGFFSGLTVVLDSYPDSEELARIGETLRRGEIVSLLVPPKSVQKSQELNHVSQEGVPGNTDRAELIRTLLESSLSSDLIVSTTGYTSRELAYFAEASDRDVPYFLCVGGMGHAGSVANQAARNWPGRVLCLDGDGSLLMHLGALSVTAASNNQNLYYLLFNNGIHESVGSQPIATPEILFDDIARVLGFQVTDTLDFITSWSEHALNQGATVFASATIRPGTISDLPRPARKPSELIDRVAKFRGNI